MPLPHRRYHGRRPLVALPPLVLVGAGTMGKGDRCDVAAVAAAIAAAAAADVDVADTAAAAVNGVTRALLPAGDAACNPTPLPPPPPPPPPPADVLPLATAAAALGDGAAAMPPSRRVGDGSTAGGGCPAMVALLGGWRCCAGSRTHVYVWATVRATFGSTRSGQAGCQPGEQGLAAAHQVHQRPGTTVAPAADTGHQCTRATCRLRGKKE